MAKTNMENIILKGITWAHSRGYTSIVAASQRFCELHPNVDIKWEKRSLQEFADAPISNLAKEYDFLIIDHPWAGFAVSSGILLPLNKYLTAKYLEDQEKNSVGKSHVSYEFDKVQSALAIDAAAPIAVYRPDYFEKTGEKIPKTFEDVLSLAKKKVVAYAGIPINLLMDFYMFCNTLTEDFFTQEYVVSNEIGTQVLETMRELASYCSKDIFNWDPINVHEKLSDDNNLFYCPFAYGYANYSRNGYSKHLLKACDVVSYNDKLLKTVLGGTGLAVSSQCKEIDIAVEFAAYAASGIVQRTLFFDCGGQPGHRSAWVDTETNRRSLNFFKDTLKTLDNSYLRPRYSGYLHFQDNAGIFVQDYVKNGGNPKETILKLNELYRKSREV